MLQDELKRRELEKTQTMSGRPDYLCSLTVMGDQRTALKSARDAASFKFLNAQRKIARMAKALSVWGWPLFRRERAKFLSLFRWERGEISRKFRGNFEISLTFQNFLRAHMRTVPCIQLPYLSISLTRFPSQNEVPRFVPL